MRVRTCLRSDWRVSSSSESRVFSAFSSSVRLHGCVSLLPQLRDKIDGAKNALLETLERIGVFNSGGGTVLLPYLTAPESLPDQTFIAPSRRLTELCARSTRARKPASSVAAISARTLRFRSMPAFFRPSMNLLYEMPGGAAGRIDADDPERAEIALLVLAADVAMTKRTFDRFLSGAIQLALGEKESLGERQGFLTICAALSSSFYSRHVFLLLSKTRRNRHVRIEPGRTQNLLAA